MITYNAVVAYMDISHQQIIVTYGCLGAILHCTAVNGNSLANHIVIAYEQSRRLVIVFAVGSRFTNLNVVGQFRGGIDDGLVMNHDV